MSLTRKHKDSHKKRTRKRTSGYQIHLYSPNNTIQPGDDFYTHINSKWLNQAEIPPTKAIFGVSEEIEKKIEQQTDVLMKECIVLSNKEPAHTYMEQVQQMIGTLAQSILTTNEQTNNIQVVKNVLASIQSLTSKEEVAVVMGEFVRYKIRGLFSIYGQYENKNHTQYTYTIGAGGLGLPDPSYYHRKSLHRSKHLVAYKQMVKKLGHLFGIPNLECVVNLERILAGVLMRTERDTIEHERTGKQLENDFPYIPFEILFATMGLHTWRSRIFYVESLRWLHTLNKVYHHLGLDYWRLLLSLEFILFSLSWLPPEYSKLGFVLYQKLLRGQQKQLPREKQAIYVVQQFATSFFSRLYVEKIIDRSVKPHIVEMLQDLLQFTEKRLGNIEWLEPKTREKAQEKVRRMRYIVAYPDHFEQHRLPKLEKDKSLFNLLQMGEWQTDYELSKLGQRISERKEWDDPVFIVNAYYYGQANEIVIPSGILQMPFYDKSRSIAWNYGGLGCILCHEITHGFDKDGKEYDPDGFQKRWWTRTDKRNYNKQTKAIIELYSKQRVSGFPVSGKKTLSENIADIGGMGIALDALHHKLDGMKLTEEERKEAYRDFFTAFAVSWRYIDKPKKRIQALIMDKHSPPFLRVNLVVSQFQEWYDAFDVKPGDKLYLPPEKRIKIF